MCERLGLGKNNASVCAFLYSDEALETMNGTILYQTIDHLTNLIASCVEEDLKLNFGV